MALDREEKELLIKLQINQERMTEILNRLTTTVEEHERRSTSLEQLVALEKKQREIDIMSVKTSVNEDFKSFFRWTIATVGGIIGIVGTVVAVIFRFLV